MTSHATFFSDSYAVAREKFCEAASRGWKLESLPREGGREGEFQTDIACAGPESPQKVLLISSGLHGVEGFLGSAIQLQLLTELTSEQLSRRNLGVILVHSLNPFGFARLRRFDENNVDLNRNFLLPEEEYRGAHPFYRQVNPLLNPTRWPKRELPVPLQAAVWILRHGFRTLQQAIAEGQYDFPHGLFFGGSGPSATLCFVEEQILPRLSGSQQVLHLDIHSGLGQYGRDKMLLDHDVQSTEMVVLENLFGQQLAHQESGVFYQARGSFNRWLRQRIPQAVSLCWEFGTYRPVSVLSALRAENAAYHWGDHRCPGFQQAKQRLKDVFIPPQRAWREMVLANARERLRDLLLIM